MHVIVLERYPSSQRGGQERSLLDVTRELAQRGHTVTLLHTRSGDLLPQYAAFCDQIITVREFNVTRHWRSLPDFLWSVWTALRQLRGSVRSTDTVIYINQPYDVPFASLFSAIAQLPLVCHLRLPAPKKLGFQCQLGLGRVRQFISVSEANRQGWLARVKAPITVVHNGMRPDRFLRQVELTELRSQWQLNPDDRIISYVGRMDQMKGIGTLIRAFAQVLDSQPNSQLLIAGKPLQADESYIEELKQLSQNLGIHDRVRFLGHVSTPAEVFHLSDLTIVPSQWAEPCARSIIESMLAGTPVIASRVGGNVELLADDWASGLFTARDVNDLVTTILNHVNWRSTDSSLGDRVQAYAQRRFDLADKLNTIEQVLVQTAAQPQGEYHVVHSS